MPVTVRRLPDEPILHAQFTGKIVEEDLLYMFARSLELMQDISGMVYRISETVNTTTSFSDLMFILSDMSARGLPGATVDPRIRAVLVGTTDDVKFVASSSGQSQYGRINLKLFATFDEALAYVREQIAAQP